MIVLKVLFFLLICYGALVNINSYVNIFKKEGSFLLENFLKPLNIEMGLNRKKPILKARKNVLLFIFFGIILAFFLNNELPEINKLLSN